MENNFVFSGLFEIQKFLELVLKDAVSVKYHLESSVIFVFRISKIW